MTDARAAAAPADPLTWGHGPKRLEVFLEPTCPFSARAFGKFDALLAAAGEHRLTLQIRLLSQPWHAFSPIVTRAVIAASTTPGGKAAAAPFERVSLQTELKWQARYARQNGVHVTPTFMIDGLIMADTGSGEPVERWLERLGLALG